MTSIRKALLAVLVTAGVVLTGCSSSSGNSSGAGSTGGGGSAPAKSSYSGTSWNATGVTQSGKSLTIPSGLVPTLAFPSDTKIVINDGLNTLTGVYTPNSSGFTVTNVSTTLTAQAGVAPDKVAVINAVDSLTSGGSSPTSVAVKVNGDQLSTTVGETVLTFQRAALNSTGGGASTSDSASVAVSPS
jgi:heat shock protein HslJ